MFKNFFNNKYNINNYSVKWLSYELFMGKSKIILMIYRNVLYSEIT